MNTNCIHSIQDNISLIYTNNEKRKNAVSKEYKQLFYI